MELATFQDAPCFVVLAACLFFFISFSIFVPFFSYFFVRVFLTPFPTSPSSVLSAFPWYSDLISFHLWRNAPTKTNPTAKRNNVIWTELYKLADQWFLSVRCLLFHDKPFPYSLPIFILFSLYAFETGDDLRWKYFHFVPVVRIYWTLWKCL